MVGVDPRMGSATLIAAAAGAGGIALGAILGAAMSWAVPDRTPTRHTDADRRALELRAEELTTRALSPGSPLACLDAVAGEGVEAACEKALFTSPATVAAATSYAAARLALLSDMVAYVKSGGANIDSSLLPLRRSLEADRFGFLAHALAVRDSCTSQDCKALDVLHDPSRVRANLSGAMLDHYLEHYLMVWTQSPDGAAVADATAAQPAAALPTGAPAQHKVNIDFPTAASIPPISIMSPEPAVKGPPETAASANPNSPGPPAGKRPRKLSGNPTAAQPAPPTGPPAAETQVDPVWLPPAAAPPQAAAANPPAANFAPAGAAPVQLNPFPSQQ